MNVVANYTPAQPSSYVDRVAQPTNVSNLFDSQAVGHIGDHYSAVSSNDYSREKKNSTVVAQLERFFNQNRGADKVGKHDLESAVSQMNFQEQSSQRNLEFRVDNDSKLIVVNVTDKRTDEIIRQIPSEDFLELARNLQSMSELADKAKKSSEGNLFDEEV